MFKELVYLFIAPIQNYVQYVYIQYIYKYPGLQVPVKSSNLSGNIVKGKAEIKTYINQG